MLNIRASFDKTAKGREWEMPVFLHYRNPNDMFPQQPTGIDIRRFPACAL